MAIDTKKMLFLEQFYGTNHKIDVLLAYDTERVADSTNIEVKLFHRKRDTHAPSKLNFKANIFSMVSENSPKIQK